MPQLKFVVEDQLLKKFKQIVIKKHGKIDLAPEGEEAIRLYIKKYEDLEQAQEENDTLLAAIGALRTGKTRSALRDLRELESNP